ncbi:MAG TPA: hypothetical protein VMT42_03440 [candidate division Zixibacteria bacterium]|nr:hypothetical protein [candidate division Zixibacteria bacterium]
MNTLFRILLATLILLSLISITVIPARAQGIPIESEIHPSQGPTNTAILIRLYTVNASVGNVTTADIFWDDSTLALNQHGVPGADGSYNYNITVPTNPPLSYTGNHTIRVESSVFNYGPTSFNFTFTITEFVPSPEYLALNATYNSLFLNYTNILGNYTQLLTNFNATSAAYADLLSATNQLNLTYGTLLSQYNSMIANYNSLVASYNSLEPSYRSLALNYTSLLTSFTSLSSNYNNLTEIYNSLNSTYTALKSDYDAARGQMAFNINLNYVLIASTIALAAIIIYLVMRKPKTPTKTR